MNEEQLTEQKCLSRRKDIQAVDRIQVQTQTELDDLGDVGQELTGIKYQDLTIPELEKIKADQKHRLTCFLSESFAIQSEIKKVNKIIRIKTQ